MNLNVRNLSLKNGPWVAIYYTDEYLEGPARKEHERGVERVKLCLKGKHGLTSLETCTWALNPPAGFGRRNFWAIARLGLTSDTTLVTEQTLGNLTAAEARERYWELAGETAAHSLEAQHAELSGGRPVPQWQYTKILQETGSLYRDKNQWAEEAATSRGFFD